MGLGLSGTRLFDALSAPGPGPLRPPLHREYARRHRICARVWAGSPPPTSAPGLGSPLPHMHRDWANPAHICTGTGAHPACICARMPRPLPAPGVCRGALQVSHRACVRRDNARRMAAAVTLQARAEPRAIPALSRGDACALQCGRCDVNATQRAACNMRQTTCNVQHAACNMNHATCRRQNCNTQHATDNIQHTTCGMQHRDCHSQRATCNVHPYSTQRATKKHARRNMQQITCET